MTRKIWKAVITSLTSPCVIHPFLVQKRKYTPWTRARKAEENLLVFQQVLEVLMNLLFVGQFLAFHCDFCNFSFLLLVLIAVECQILKRSILYSFYSRSGDFYLFAFLFFSFLSTFIFLSFSSNFLLSDL